MDGGERFTPGGKHRRPFFRPNRLVFAIMVTVFISAILTIFTPFKIFVIFLPLAFAIPRLWRRR